MPPFTLIYFSAITLVTVIVTVYDKIAAKKFPRNRIPEKMLFTLAFLGGAAGEYATMQIIRHKTKHKEFMIGLPIIILLQVSAAAIILIFL